MKQPKAREGQLRIIAGEWRSRRFSFTEQPGLRPTPDRVRETLFNWLSMHIEGSRCLDLFAGSGALTLEALSRGAAHALACDMSRDVVATLRGHLQTLQCDRGEVRQQDALTLVAGAAESPFDLVFLDPPFHQDLLIPACTALETNGWLAPDALIYTESETAPGRLPFPANWHLHREKKAGQVWYSLWQREG
ncbi:16S rRNA (guanine(966)-N(2))-methyltransferase RsmD [Halopseudomonas sp. SMJS2]|uniref:16S rRNA (guanine(966)-N(2))-methyltransferase RsmD n=1 Tax=Halopseudomonas sp. SMJS2 TaxID=3041098 RepID=UPI0024529678|nr:16S rRNA (guanine(966)-N(2))-methyltransferase RsmD [Halopseudomonas sp. SMJS2]WGK61510.1 16S rRNA (guanine(966)-N(2))-methyltransferase RsmD [Halopseudomonas sp. SMJS2]